MHFTSGEVKEGKLFAVLAYILSVVPFLFFLPFLKEKENRFVMFHTFQGIILTIIVAILNLSSIFFGSVLGSEALFGTGILLILIVIIFWFIGIISAIQGKAKGFSFIVETIAKFNLVK